MTFSDLNDLQMMSGRKTETSVGDCDGGVGVSILGLVVSCLQWETQLAGVATCHKTSESLSTNSQHVTFTTALCRQNLRCTIRSSPDV